MTEHAPTLDLRVATAADQPLLAALYQAARDDLAQLGDHPAVVQLIAMQYRVHADGLRRKWPSARQLLLHAGDACIAQLVLDSTPQRIYLVDIAVMPAARRQGWGRALLRWAQRQAAAVGVPLALQVQRHNTAALGLYLSAGFVPGDSDQVFQHMQWQAPAHAAASHD